MVRSVGERAIVLLAVLLVSGCKTKPVPTLPKISIRASTTRGAPVTGAEVMMAGVVLARSDAAGAAKVDVGGSEGDTFELQVRCPSPLKSPAAPLVIRRLEIAGGDVEHAVKCEETRRTLVVVVRAEGGPDLPILYLGKEIGRTDASGAAHVRLDTDIKDRVELILGTDGAQMAGAHPQNPSATFEPADHDEVKEMSVTFKRDAKPKPHRVAPKGPVQF